MKQWIHWNRRFAMRRTMSAVFAVLIGLPAVAHATAFSTSATFDLTSPSLIAPITPVTLGVGDTLSANVTFADSQALQIGNAGSLEYVDLWFLPVDLAPGSNSFSGTYSMTLTGLSGELLVSLPFAAYTSGQFLDASVFGDLTNSNFTFTDLHADLTLTAAPEPFTVDRLRFLSTTPSTVVTSSFPEPGTLFLLGLGLMSVSATALRRRGWSRGRSTAALQANSHATSTRSRQWNARDMWQYPRLVVAAIACVALLGASKARAEQVIDLVMPFVQAVANDNTTPVVSVDDFSDPLDPLVKAEAIQGGAHAVGRVGIVDFVRVDAPGEGGGGVEVLMEFTVEDPQQRPQIKSILNFTGVAASPPDPSGSRLGGASWQVIVGQSDGGPLQLLVHDDLSSQVISAPQFVGTPLFQLDMDVESGGGGTCHSFIDMHGQRVSTRSLENCGSISEGGRLELTHAPGTYLMRVIVLAGNNATVVGDPVWRPHPDNPDVVVVRHAPTGSPGAPLAGTTPADLAARSIDPTPFIDAGFFDTTPPPPPPPPPAGDTTPPTTLASATPGANAKGWNKTSVTIALSSTDNAGGSGVKEVHYSLDGAATGSQVVPGGGTTVTVSAEGTTTLTYFAVDNAGNQEAAKTLTVRIDRTAPTVTGLPSNCSLWPPDHALVQVASVTARDGLSGLAGTPTVTATSNEPENGTGDGDLAPDVVISGGTVQVRAERAGSGTGRLYTITATASDLAGNTTTQTATCNVPHDGGRTAQQ